MSEHRLKCWPYFFNQIVAGEKTHELRRTDRDFSVGDRLVLEEYEPVNGAYTGRTATVEVTCITSSEQACALSDEALGKDFCIMSVRLPPNAKTQAR